MRPLLLALALATLAPTAASAAPARAFPATQTFAACQDTWMFACGKRDAAGNTYGTAHKRTHCQRYVFHPDGTATVRVGPVDDAARYRIVGRALHLEVLGADGAVVERHVLTLSADGRSLDGVPRVD